MIIYNINTEDGADCGTPRVVGRPRSGIVQVIRMVGQRVPRDATEFARRFCERAGCELVTWLERAEDMPETCTADAAESEWSRESDPECVESDFGSDDRGLTAPPAATCAICHCSGRLEACEVCGWGVCIACGETDHRNQFICEECENR